MDQPPSSAVRRSLKRKLEQEFEEDGADQLTADRKGLVFEPQKPHRDLLSEVVSQVTILNSSFSSSQSDRLAAKRAVHVLCEVAKNEELVSSIVGCGAVPALLRHLKAPETVREGDGGPKPYEHEVEKGCAFVLGLLAVIVIQHFSLALSLSLSQDSTISII